MVASRVGRTIRFCAICCRRCHGRLTGAAAWWDRCCRCGRGQDVIDQCCRLRAVTDRSLFIGAWLLRGAIFALSPPRRALYPLAMQFGRKLPSPFSGVARFDAARCGRRYL
jgi:hypothetical protein